MYKLVKNVVTVMEMYNCNEEQIDNVLREVLGYFDHQKVSSIERAKTIIYLQKHNAKKKGVIL